MICTVRVYANPRFKSVAVSVLIFASRVSMAAARHLGFVRRLKRFRSITHPF